jgi:hypothetical protein
VSAATILPSPLLLRSLLLGRCQKKSRCAHRHVGGMLELENLFIRKGFREIKASALSATRTTNNRPVERTARSNGRRNHFSKTHPPCRRLKRFTEWIRKLDRHSTMDYNPRAPGGGSTAPKGAREGPDSLFTGDRRAPVRQCRGAASRGEHRDKSWRRGAGRGSRTWITSGGPVVGVYAGAIPWSVYVWCYVICDM